MTRNTVKLKNKMQRIWHHKTRLEKKVIHTIDGIN